MTTSNNGEIITLQFGHYANFIGTHFWNIQDESLLTQDDDHQYSADVLYNCGVTSKGIETYTPRLLLFDLKGSWGNLRKSGYLYDSSEKMSKDEVSSTWYGLHTHTYTPNTCSLVVTSCYSHGDLFD